jgi:hypothetical protein
MTPLLRARYLLVHNPPCQYQTAEVIEHGPHLPSNTGPSNGPAAASAAHALFWEHNPVSPYLTTNAIKHTLYMQGWGPARPTTTREMGPSTRFNLIQTFFPWTWTERKRLPPMLKRPSSSSTDSRPLKKHKAGMIPIQQCLFPTLITHPSEKQLAICL